MDALLILFSGSLAGDDEIGVLLTYVETTTELRRVYIYNSVIDLIHKNLYFVDIDVLNSVVE
jgi:hypothetical protein